jgi:predicted dienelactone hydrolase
MRVLKALAAALLLLAIGMLSLYGATAPKGPQHGSASADRLRPGPHAVGRIELELSDATRPTRANGSFPGAPSRALPATLWFPESTNGAHPLVVYSHGFMSTRSEAEPTAEDLASHGFVVIAADFPLTSFHAPGGPIRADAVNQPGDVAFLIDTVTGWGAGDRPFRGEIDLQRIGAAGLSLGGFTTMVAAFHPTRRDPRISAAVAIAGRSAMFAPSFFSDAEVPLLTIAGDSDALVDYAANAASIPDKLAHGGALLTLHGGSHAGFAPQNAGVMRIFGNPDRIACWVLRRRLGAVPIDDSFTELVGKVQGVLHDSGPPPCADGPAREAIAAERQQMIARLAMRAFFESVWANDAEERATAGRYLAQALPADFSEVTYQAIATRPSQRVAAFGR